MNREFNLSALFKSTISLSFEPSYILKPQFHILDAVDSTNNYAMARVNDGLAHHGEAWFAHEQTAGRGQPGKYWTSEKGKNVLMSMAVRPELTVFQNIFHFNAYISSIIRDFIQKKVSENVFLKWPNDFFLNDRKAGGMLIENKFQGSEWKWSIIGIGINVNQRQFEPGSQAISLCSSSTMDLNPDELAQGLHLHILEKLIKSEIPDFDQVLDHYNSNLYKKNEFVSLAIEDKVHQCQILEVNKEGFLLVDIDGDIKKIRHGQARWNLSKSL